MRKFLLPFLTALLVLTGFCPSETMPYNYGKQKLLYYIKQAHVFEITMRNKAAL